MKTEKDIVFLCELRALMLQMYDEMLAVTNRYSLQQKYDKILWRKLCKYSGWFFDTIYYKKDEIDVCLAKYWLDLFMEELPDEFKSLVHVDKIKVYLPKKQNCLLETKNIQNERQDFKCSNGNGFYFKMLVLKQCQECQKKNGR